MNTFRKTKEYLKLVVLFILIGLISCSEDKDYSSPDLELIPLNLETEINSVINKGIPLKPVFENAAGALSYVWKINNTVLSSNDDYVFNPAELGQYFVDVYVEDAEGKYANIRYKILISSDVFIDNKNKVVAGYFPSYRSGSIRWNEITHLIYGFIYPNKDGTLNTQEISKLDQYVLDAKLNNTKILLSIGGNENYPGREDRVFTDVISNDNTRAALIRNLKSFVTDHELDGIDIYYNEFTGGGETVDTNDAKKLLLFYQELRQALADKYSITAAITGSYNWIAYNYRDIAGDMTKVVSFISVMSFDNTGTFEESELNQHSSIADARIALDTYVSFGISKEKLVLGVPFYGRDFLTSTGGFASAISYADILSIYTPTVNELFDGNINREGHNIFFNSQEIIKEKVAFVKADNFKGITFWELGQDTGNETLALSKNILVQLVE